MVISKIDPYKMMAETESEVVAFMEFSRLFKKNINRLFCFLEGDEDDKYYASRIDGHFKDALFLPCYGKHNVKKVYKQLKNNKEYKTARTAFFVDRDFDESIKVDYPEVYETPCYSFENFYTSKQAFIKMLEGIFRLYKGNENFEILLNLFEKLQAEFHGVITELNAWIYLQRKKELMYKKKKRLNLNDKFKKYDKLYLIKIDTVQKKYKIEEIKSLFPDSYDINDDELNIKIKEFEKQNKQQLFRGKFEFDFLCKSLDKLIEEYGKCRNGNSKLLKKMEVMKKVSLKISNEGTEDMLNRLSMYADTPECLVEYLESIKKQYNEVI